MPELDDKKKALLARLLAKEGLTTQRSRDIIARGRAEPAPLSFAQRRLWLLEQMALPGPPAYNMPAAWIIDGPLDTRALGDAFNRILARHEILRTRIVMIDGEPHQVVDAGATLEIICDDAQHDADALARFTAAADALAIQPFDLGRAPLLRAHLTTLATDRHGLAVVLHHIVADGWSLPILMRELVTEYADARHGRPSSLPPLPLQYADYSEWHHAAIASADGHSHRDFWMRVFAHPPAPADIPASAPRPTERSFHGAGLRRRFPTDLATALHRLARAEGASVFVTLLASVQVLLARMSGQEDVIVGSPMAGRVRPELGDQIGFYVNMLPLRTVIDHREPFRSLLRRVGAATAQALEHEIYPFDQLVHDLHLDRDLARSPLFDVVVVVEQADDSGLAFDGLTVQPLERPRVSSKFDLTFHFVESAHTLDLTVEYSTDLFTGARAAQIAQHLETLLQAIVREPGTAISHLPLLSTAERVAALERGTASVAPALKPSVIHRFDAAAAAQPEAIAVTYEADSLSYGELDQRANQVARQLIAAGVGAESRVGVCMTRSIDLVVAILGVLKAGGAYVPLDPSYPVDRLRYLIADSGMTVVLRAPGDTPEAFSDWRGTTLVVDGALLASVPDGPLHTAVAPEQAAYVIYTSGSTGQPKGCIVTHGNMARLFGATDAWFRFGPNDTWTLFHSYAFDFSVWELWGALAYGGRLVVVPYWISRSPEAFLALLARERVTVLNQTPSAFRELMRADASAPQPLALREVIFGGEALDIPALAPWFRARGDRAPRLVNMYGITETTVHVTYRPVTEADVEARAGSLIGVPIPDLGVYLLDPNFEPVPPGVTGEIFVGGAGVCRGYLDRPALTAERFVPDPFATAPGARLYRSGDLGRWTDAGDIEYLGRGDAQVKIRGFRIETGEIEAALRAAEGVTDAIVIARAHADGRQLIGYVVAPELAALDVATLRAGLERALPDYMVPAHIVRIDARPLTAHGKLDVAALPAPEHVAGATFVAPRNEAEATLAAVWAEALGVERVGIDDNYFELGGDSILALRVIAAARARGVAFSIRDLYQRRTVRALCEATTDAAPGGPVDIARAPFALLSDADRARVPAGAEDAYPQSRLQAGMFFHTALDPESAVFHDLFSYRLDLPFDANAFRDAAAALVARHPVLRTSFHWAPYDEPLQIVWRAASPLVEVHDLSDVPVDRHDEVIAHWLEREKRQTFDSATPALLRLHLHARGPHDVQLTADFHHAILDGWSFATLMSELIGDYLGRIAPPAGTPTIGVPHTPEPPAGQFREFIALERAALADATSRTFWAAQVRELPATRLPRSSSTAHGAVSFEVPLADGDAVQARAQALGVPVKSLCLAAHAAVLSFLTGEAEVVTGLTTNGRPDAEGAESVAGLFLNTVPFRIETGTQSWRALIDLAFARERDLLPHRRFPLSEIKTLAGGRELYDAGFNFVHFHVYKGVGERAGVSSITAFEQTDYAFVANFSIDPRDGALALRLSYDAAEFSDAAIRRMGRAYARALDAAARQPDACWRAAALMDDLDTRAALARARGPETPAPAWTLVARLEDMTRATPDAVALVVGDRTWSYRALDAESTRVAHHLRARGVGANTVVGLCLTRTEWLVIGLLATLKAGGAYVPIDPFYPDDRIDYLRRDSGAAVVLTDGTRDGIDITALGAAPALPPGAPDADDLAYVIYTSGSTGPPKGVMVTHRGLAHYLEWAIRAYRLTAGSRSLVHSSVSFDATITSLLAPLVVGGTVELVPDTHAVATLADALAHDTPYALVKITPAHLDLLRHELGASGLVARVAVFVIGGEALLDTTLAWWRQAAPRARFINEYGPTETVVGCAVYEDRGAGPAAVPIGRPIDRMRVYVLDGGLAPVPPGTTGEIFIGGEGVARGYLGRPDLTSARFLPDPFSPVPGARMYRTGDLARWREDDILEYLGRNDFQVKVRGHRVELGEIETVLAQHPDLTDVAVIAEAVAGTHQLLAFLVARDGQAPTLDDVRAFVAARLPEPLVPSRFALVDALPLTAHGKVDRAALLATATTALETSTAFVAPANDAEALLAGIWADVLGRERVGVTDDYFTSGGDSLKALQVVSRASRAGWALRVRDVFTFPTIAELARHATRDVSAADQGAIIGPALLLPIQRWFFEDHPGPYHHFNQGVVLRWRGTVQAQVLADALTALADHHDVLRAHFRQTADGLWTQTIAPPGTQVAVTSAPTLEAAASIHGTLDPSDGRLIAAAVVADPAGDRVLIAIHHLVVDGVSWRVLLEDLHTAYTQRAEGRSVTLPPKTVSVREWAAVVETFAASATARAEHEYWRDIAATPAALPVVMSDADHDRGDGPAHEAVSRLDRETTARLFGEAHRAYRTQANDLLLAGLAQALERVCGARETLVTVEGHGRHERLDADVSRTVGWFTSRYPVRLDCGASDLRQLIRHTKEMLRRVPSRGLGYGVLRYLGTPDEAHALACRPPVGFNYLGSFDTGPAHAAFVPTDEPAGAMTPAGWPRDHDIEVLATVFEGALEIRVTGTRGRTSATRIVALADAFADRLRAIVAHCLAQPGEPTPSDLTAPGLDLRAFDALLAAHDRTPAEIDDVLPLSPMQEGFLLHALSEDSGAYFEQSAYRLRGTVDAPTFEAAWNRLLTRYPNLRVQFWHDDLSRPVQAVVRDRRVAFVHDDWRALDPSTQRARLAAFRADDRHRGFDLTRNPLVRVALFQVADDAFDAVWSFPHLLLDGWSAGILLGELLTIYAALIRRSTQALPEPAPYRRYLQWLEGRDRTQSTAFWRAYLDGYDEAVSVPAARRAVSQPYRATSLAWTIDANDTRALKSLAARLHVTTSIAVQTLWAALLASYADRDDVVFGATVSGRPEALAGVERMVGLFINTLPVRVSIGRDESFARVAARAQAAHLAAEPHASTPLAEIQSLGALGSRLFDHILVFENYPLDQQLRELGSSLRVESSDVFEQVHYDLGLLVAEDRSTLQMRFIANAAAYPDAQLRRVAGHFVTLLRAVVAAPEAALRQHAIVPPDERAALAAFNVTAGVPPAGTTLVDLLEMQAAATPASVALIDGDTALTYADLHARADQWAAALRHRGVGPETLVGVFLHRSADLIAGILAVLKAGGAYVPLDPNYPADRIAFLLDDAQMALVLTERRLRADVPRPDAEVWCLDDTPPAARAPRSAHLDARNLAYIIYTSGSTGTPKGTAISHGAAAALVEWARHTYTPAELSGVLASTSVCFDLSVFEIFVTLSTGGAVILAENALALPMLPAASRVTLVNTVPSAMTELVRMGGVPASVRTVNLAGEPLPASLVDALYAVPTVRRVCDLYGPSEDTTYSTFAEREAGGPETIGGPLSHSHTEVHLLDRWLEPVPIGVAGELYLSGEKLCRGYLNRAALTAERFVPNPFATRPGARMYRTGDLARYREDGRLEFLGRMDHQVKIRGFRIELGEIEAALTRTGWLDDVAVVARDDAGGKTVVAYLVTGSGAPRDAAPYRDALARTLPDYMVPAHVVFLDRLPRTPNGKLDRKALPAPAAAAAVIIDLPRTALEATLAALWRDALGLDEIGVFDSFFDLGGHSLTAARLIARARQSGLDVSLRDLFTSPTIAALAATLASRQRVAVAPIPVAAPAPHYPVSFGQRRLWVLEQLRGDGPTAYNVPAAFLLRGRVDAPALERAFGAVLARHAALRTAIVVVDGEPRQQIRDDAAFALTVKDMSRRKDPRAAFDAFMREQAHTPFDLATAPLLRATLCRIARDTFALTVVVHHIAMDGWSIPVLMRDLVNAYRDARGGQAPALPALPLRYVDFAAWQRAELADDRVAPHRAYWRDVFAEPPAPLELPTDRPRGPVQTFEGGQYELGLDAALAASLRALAAAEGASLFMTLLAATTALLARTAGQRDITVGSPIAGRTHPDLDDQIGYFVNTVPLRLTLGTTDSFATFVGRARDAVTAAYEHQAYPFDRLVDDLALPRDLARSPLFDVMIAMEHADSAALTLPDIAIEPVPVDYGISKFDLTITFRDRGSSEGVGVFFEYNSALFDRATIARWARRLDTLLRSAVRRPSDPVDRLPILPADERHAVLAATNFARLEHAQGQSLAALFEAQARRTPDLTALVFAARRWTYRALDRRANGVAAALRARGITTETAVGLAADASDHLIVGVLGILKAGGAYVPLDPAYPRERNRGILADAGVRVIVAASGIETLDDQLARLDVDDIADADAPPARLDGDDTLAYVIYTSGSTGRPKGVAVTHRGVINLLADCQERAPLSHGDAGALWTSAAFDVSVYEIFAALLSGGTLHVVPPAMRGEAAAYFAWLERERVASAYIAPFQLAAFRAFLEAEPRAMALRRLLVGVEPIDEALLAAIRARVPGLVIVNGYGPTETTVCATLYSVPANASAGVTPIGVAVANTGVFIVDALGEPVGVGVTGEIVVAGEGLARGYLQDAAATAAAFVPSALGPHAGARWYRTGDHGYRRPDGAIVFAGRRDHQVKIRGHRVELGEVERAVTRHPSVTDAAVIARGTGAAAMLIAWIVCREDAPSIESMRAFLATLLPESMIPGRFVVVDALPVTTNGKLDRRALATRETAGERLLGVANGAAAPRDTRERALATVWADVLGAPHIGIHDNYFALGGDSIKAIQIAARAGAHGLSVTIRDVFAHPTVAALALVAATRTAAPQGPVHGEAPLTAIQQWFFREHPGPFDHFNQAVLLQWRERADERALHAAVTAILEHHDGLRSRFTNIGGTWRQTVETSAELAWTVQDFRALPRDEAVAQMTTLANTMHRGLDLAAGRLVAAGLFRLPDGDRVLLVIHHLVVDGVSWRVLLEDLDAAYQRAAAQPGDALPLRTHAFRDWAIAAAAAAPREAERPYWAAVIANADAALVTPSAARDVISASLDIEPTATLLSAAATRPGLETTAVLLGALTTPLARAIGRTRFLIDLEGHGREASVAPLDVSRTVGWFTSLYPFALDAGAGATTLDRTIDDVQRRLRQVPDHGVGFGLLRYRDGAIGSELRYRAVASFNYLGQFDTDGQAQSFTFARESSGAPTSAQWPHTHALDIGAYVDGRQLHVSVTFDRDSIGATAAAALLSSYLDRLREAAAWLADEARAFKALAERHGVARDEITAVLPLGPMQEGMLFNALYERETGAYFEQLAYRIHGDVDPARFTRAWQQLLDRHAHLRVSIWHTGVPRPLAVVRRDQHIAVTSDDWRRLAPDAQHARLGEYRREDRDRRFDLERDPLMRFGLFQLADHAWCVVWSYPHLLLDGWSTGLLLSEFLACYDDAGDALPAAVPYTRYLDWLASQDASAALERWRARLDDYEDPAVVPMDPLQRSNGTQPRQSAPWVLSATETAGLRSVATAWGVTLNSLLLTLWGVLLGRMNDCTDVVFGSTVSGRPEQLEGVERMIGLFINTLPVRVQWRESEPIAALAARVQREAIAAQADGFLPLADIQRTSTLRGALFDHLLIFENYPLDERLQELGATSRQWSINEVDVFEETHYAFVLAVAPGRDRLNLRCTFDASVYSPERIAAVEAAWHALLAEVIAAPDARVRAVNAVPPTECERLTKTWARGTAVHDAAAGLAGADTLSSMLDAALTRTSEAVAVESAGATLTFRALHARADVLAGALLTAGVTTDTPVGLCLPRSLDLVVAMLAIVKAGGAYVPIDPDYPSARVTFMAADAGLRLVVTAPGVLADDAAPSARRVFVDARAETAPPARPRDEPASLAYVLYTSGSTGQPKGVGITHSALANHMRWMARAFPLKAGDRVFQKTPFSFDASVWEFWAPLLEGVTLVMAEPGLHQDPCRLAEHIVQERITVLQVVPTLLQALVEEPAFAHATSLRRVFVGGEAFTVALRDRVRACVPHAAIVNLYGPTETSIDSTSHDCRLDGHDAVVPIGTPVDGLTAYVFDHRMALSAVGAWGELFIGGAGVGRGYLGRPDVTAAAFVPDPIASTPGERLYRTGDRARWLASGVLEYGGRVDDQVKVRGFRIELGEVDVALRALDGVVEAAAAVTANGTELSAFVVLRPGARPAAELRQMLRSSGLAPQMIPTRWVPVDALPRTTSGKLDRRALLTWRATEADAPLAAPETDRERVLADVWAAALGRGALGRDENFFDAGGHSLTAARTAAELSRRLERAVTVRDIFTYPTVAALAAYLDAAEWITSTPASGGDNADGEDESL